MNHQIVQTLRLLVPLLVSCNAMADGMFNITAGHEQTSGTYGLATETKIENTSLLVQYSNEAWLFSVYTPFVSVIGDSKVTPNSGGMLSDYIFTPMQPAAENKVVTRSGLGDISNRLSYAFFPEKDSHMYYELMGELKLGTASVNKNLGTGENNYSLSLYGMYGKYDLKPFLSLGHLTIGDTDLVDYNDVFFAAAGFNYQINSKTLFGLTYDYQQASIDGVDDVAIINLNLSHKLNAQWSTNVYFLIGLSDSVAESGAGLALRRQF